MCNKCSQEACDMKDITTAQVLKRVFDILDKDMFASDHTKDSLIRDIRYRIKKEFGVE